MLPGNNAISYVHWKVLGYCKPYLRTVGCMHLHNNSISTERNHALLSKERWTLIQDYSTLNIFCSVHVILKDELQFRRKEKPINICVDLYPGGDRKITVNSGFPLTDVVAAICKEVGMFVYGRNNYCGLNYFKRFYWQGIENHAELSLVLPGKNNKFMQRKWNQINVTVFWDGSGPMGHSAQGLSVMDIYPSWCTITV